MRRLVLLLTATLGCGSAESSSGAPGGEVTVSWSGASTGRLSAPGEASWCPRDTLLEIIAVRNDSAVGLTLLPKDSLVPGHFSIFSTPVFLAFRPQANLALRYLEPQALLGFEGLSGRVVLSESPPGTVSGELEASLRGLGGADTIHLTGSFRRVPVRPALPACGRSNRPGSG